MFYHIGNLTLEETAISLAGRALARDWRVMLRGPDRAALERLDERLWLYPDDGFLPHGLEGGPYDADQPLLLGQGAAVNGARALMLLAGVSVDPEEARRMERVWLLFEAADAAQVAAARAEWRAVTAAGLAAEYWSDEGGRWARKAQSRAGEAVSANGG